MGTDGINSASVLENALQAGAVLSSVEAKAWTQQMLQMAEVTWWVKPWWMYTCQNAESEEDANSLLLSNSEGGLAL